MLSKNRPVKLFPFMAGMLDGASHPINPKPITFKSVRSQSLSKHVNFPPEAFASLRGFLAVTGAFKNPEVRDTLFVERGEDPKPTTAEALAIEAAIFLSWGSSNWDKRGIVFLKEKNMESDEPVENNGEGNRANIVANSMEENFSGAGGGGYGGNFATEDRVDMVDSGDEHTESREEGELCSDSDVLLHLSRFGV